MIVISNHGKLRVSQQELKETSDQLTNNQKELDITDSHVRYLNNIITAKNYSFK